MAKRKQVEDLGTVRVDPQATPNSSFFLAQSPSLGRGDSGFGDFIQSAAKLYGNIKLQEREEDIAQGEAMFQEKQAEIAEKMSKQETVLKGFAQAVYQDLIAEQNSPGTVIGYRKAAGRFFAQDYSRRAQEALDKALNEEYVIDPNTTIPTAPRSPEQVLREVETKFEQDAENGTAKWLLKDYYGKQTYLDLKAQTSNSLLNEYSQRFNEKRKELHREMLAAEGVALLSKLNKEVSEGRTPEGVVYAGKLPFTEEEARAEFKEWARKVYLGSVKNPSEFVANVLSAAIDRAQKDEAIRLDKIGEVPSDEEVGSVLFERFKDTVVGTAPLSKSQALAFDKIESQLLQDKDRSLSRSNALYQANRVNALNEHISNPDGIHIGTIRTVRDVGEYEARKQLEAWYTKALATNVPYAEEKYQATIQSLDRTLNTSPVTIQDKEYSSNIIREYMNPSEGPFLDPLRDYSSEDRFGRAVEDANRIDNIDLRTETINRLYNLNRVKDRELRSDREYIAVENEIKQFNSNLPEFFQSLPGTVPTDLISDSSDMVKQSVKDKQAEADFQIKIQELIESGKPKEEIIKEAKALKDAFIEKSTKDYTEIKRKQEDVLRPLFNQWKLNKSSASNIDSMYENRQIDYNDFTRLKRLDDLKSTVVSRVTSDLSNNSEFTNLVKKSIVEAGVINSDPKALEPNLEFKSWVTEVSSNNATSGGTKTYGVSTKGQEVMNELISATDREVVEHFSSTPELATAVRDPQLRRKLISDKFTEILKNKIEAKTKPIPPSSSLIHSVSLKDSTKLNEHILDSNGLSAYLSSNNLPGFPGEYTVDQIRMFNQKSYEGRQKIVGRDATIPVNMKVYNKIIPDYAMNVALILKKEDPNKAAAWKDYAIKNVDDHILNNIDQVSDGNRGDFAISHKQLIGIDWKEVLDSKMTIKDKEIPFAPASVNWRITPLFKTKEELNDLFIKEPATFERLAKALGIDFEPSEDKTPINRLKITQLALIERNK